MLLMTIDRDGLGDTRLKMWTTDDGPILYYKLTSAVGSCGLKQTFLYTVPTVETQVSLCGQ